jgi:hypothetical protein
MSEYKYLCQLCNTGYSSYENLIEHEAKHLATSRTQHKKKETEKMEYNTPSVLSEAKYHCVFCNNTFETVLQLNSHINIWHSSDKGIQKAKPADEAELKRQKEVILKLEDRKRMAMDVAIPPLPKVDEVSYILEDREKRYANFAHNAHIVQALRRILHDQVTWKALPFDSQLAIEMILLKIVRIVNGGMPDYIDNWLDIAGYATLVKNRIEGKNCE